MHELSVLPVTISYNNLYEDEIEIVTIHSKRFTFFYSVILVVIVASIEKLLESGIGWLPYNTVHDETALTTTSPCNLRRDNIRWTLMTPARCYRQYRRGRLFPSRRTPRPTRQTFFEKDPGLRRYWRTMTAWAGVIMCIRVWGGRELMNRGRCVCVCVCTISRRKLH